MNTLVIVLIAAVCLIAAYAFYGRWIARKWGIDPKAKTPAVVKNDGKDYVPTNGWTVFSHQFQFCTDAFGIFEPDLVLGRSILITEMGRLRGTAVLDLHAVFRGNLYSPDV